MPIGVASASEEMVGMQRITPFLWFDTEGEAAAKLYLSLFRNSGGQPSQCGWLKDRYGLSWQIIPTILNKLLTDPDPARARRAMQAMLQMKKIDVTALTHAADGD